MSNLRNSYGRITQGNVLNDRVSLPFFINVTDDGLPTGNSDMTVDGSVTPVEFWIQPPSGTTYNMLIATLGIGDMANLSQTDYGNLPMLTNGVEFFFELNGVTLPTTAPIKSNSEAIGLVSSVDFIEFSGNVRVMRLSEPFLAFSKGIVLNGDTNDRFVVKIQDDLTGLIQHTEGIRGMAWKNSD